MENECSTILSNFLSSWFFYFQNSGVRAKISLQANFLKRGSGILKTWPLTGPPGLELCTLWACSSSVPSAVGVLRPGAEPPCPAMQAAPGPPRNTGSPFLLKEPALSALPPALTRFQLGHSRVRDTRYIKKLCVRPSLSSRLGLKTLPQQAP